MDGKEYLKSYGWREGEALRHGGLKKPILVKHKKDKKGLGCAPGHDDGEAWWERLFDGQLRGLDVKSGSGGISFEQTEVVAAAVTKSESPLYNWFVKGEVLKGTIEAALVPSLNKGSTVVRAEVKDKKKKKKSKVAKKSKKDKHKKDKHKHKKESKDKRKHKKEKSH